MPELAALTQDADPTLAEQATQALRLIATVLGHDPAPSDEECLTWRERVVLTIACDALGLDDPVDSRSTDRVMRAARG